MTRITSKDIARSLPLADLSSLPTSNPGGNKPWRSAGTTGWQIVVGNFTAPGVTDHGALTGLADDDHPQYYNQARGDARYLKRTGPDTFSGELTLAGGGSQVQLLCTSWDLTISSLIGGAAFRFLPYAGDLYYDLIGNLYGKHIMRSANYTIFTASVTSIDCYYPLKLPSYIVGTLPPASSVGAGATAYVTDANATTYRSVVAGGGSNALTVFSDGTNWRIG